MEEFRGEGGADVEKSFSRFLLGLLVSSCFRLKLMDAPYLLRVMLGRAECRLNCRLQGSRLAGWVVWRASGNGEHVWLTIFGCEET